MADGTKKTIAARDSYTIPPGHDAWFEGSEPFIAIEVERGALREGLMGLANAAGVAGHWCSLLLCNVVLGTTLKSAASPT
jgi:hypothetical protein